MIKHQFKIEASRSQKDTSVQSFRLVRSELDNILGLYSFLPLK